MTSKIDKIKSDNASMSIEDLEARYNYHSVRIFSLLGNIQEGHNPLDQKTATKLSLVATIIGLDSAVGEMTIRLANATGVKMTHGYANLVDGIRKATQGTLLTKDQLDDLKLLRLIRNTFAHKVDMIGEFDLFFEKNPHKTLKFYFMDVQKIFGIMSAEVKALQGQALFPDCGDVVAENRRKILL